jgi:hypothetical protein
LRSTFIVHMVIGGLLGAAIFIVPGRTLTLLGWVPQWVQLPDSELSIPGQTFIDPVIIRLLGATLLALAFSSFLGWRAGKWGEVALLVQTELVYCALGALAFIAGLFLLDRPMPVSGYVLLVILVAFAVAWVVALRQGSRA